MFVMATDAIWLLQTDLNIRRFDHSLIIWPINEFNTQSIHTTQQHINVVDLLYSNHTRIIHSVDITL